MRQTGLKKRVLRGTRFFRGLECPSILLAGRSLSTNYDSFTFNVAQMVAEASGEEPVVLPNSVPWREIRKIPHRRIILSPGPGTPQRAADVGCSMDVLRYAECPVLGICLGHQCLVAYFGGTVARAPEPFHGRISRIHCRLDPLFHGDCRSPLR
jgi:anthranilate synthase component 2